MDYMERHGADARHTMKVLQKFDAYSSQVELVEIDGAHYIYKTVDREEAVNERRFLQTMQQHGLPSLKLYDNIIPLEDNQLLLEYIPGSEKINYRDVVQVRDWGAAARKMHDIRFDRPFRITENGEEENVDWNEFLRARLLRAADGRRGGKTDLSDQAIDEIVEYTLPRLNFAENSYSLLHGDMHDGNTLKRIPEVIIYDKSSEIFAGHYMYDLAMVTILYPNGLYIRSEEPHRQDDAQLRAAFIAGYGEDFISDHKDQLDTYMMIQNLDRYPNIFVGVEKEMFKTILGK